MSHWWRALVVWSVVAACASGDRNTSARSVPRPRPSPPPAAVPPAAGPSDLLLDGFREVAAPSGAWGDHVLRVAPGGEVWLASFRRGDAGVQMTPWRDGWGVTRTPRTPQQAPNTILDFEVDASGSVYLAYPAANGTIASFGRGDGTEELRSITLPGRAALGRDSVGRAVALVHGEGLLLQRFDGEPPRSLSITMPEDAGLLAFHVGDADDVRIATLDRIRRRVVLIGTDGVRETLISEDFCPERFVSAAFDGQGRLHVAADRCDAGQLLYVTGDAAGGLRATSFAPAPDRRVAHPIISIGPRYQVLVVLSSTREDLSDPQIDLAVIENEALTAWRRVGPYDLHAERYTAATVDGTGHVFIGGWASMGTGNGLVRTNAPPDAR